MDASSAARRVDLPEDGSGAAPAAPQLLGEVIVLSTSDELLLELGQLLGAQVIVRPTESLGALADLVIPTRPQILVIECTDVAALESELRAASFGPRQMPTVVFVDAPALREATPPLRRAGVRVVLPLPLASGETRTVLRSELETVRAAIAARIAAGERFTLAAPDPDAGPGATASPRRTVPKPLWLTGTVVLAVVAAAGVWHLWKGSGGAAVMPDAARTQGAQAVAGDTAPAPVLIVGGSVEELLEKARAAMRDRRYTEPREDSAFLYFRSAVAQEPANAEALDGLQRLSALVTARLEQALDERHPEEAARAASDLRSLRGRDPHAAALELRMHNLQMSAALESGSTERIAGALRQAAQSGVVPQPQLNQWRADLTRRQEGDRVARLVAHGGERLRAGQLLEPPGASAQSFAAQALQLAPADPAAERLARDVAAALLQRAREAGLRTPEGERALTEARALGASPAQIAALQTRESPVRSKAASEAEHAAEAQAALEAAAQARAAQQAAQARRAEPAVEQVVSAGGLPVIAHEKLRRTRAIAPEYPALALRSGASGRVTVRFVVDAHGEPQDVQVIDAEPKGVFDRASLAAVRRWRYEPWTVAGEPVAVETSLVIRFAPAEQER